MSCNKPMKSAAFGNFTCGTEIQGSVRLCEDCLRIHRANIEFLGQTKPEDLSGLPTEKRDFENLDVRLYLALKAVLPYAENESEALHTASRHDDEPELHAVADRAANAIEAAQKTLRDFEDSFGPLPEFAIARNYGLELTPGTQLFTKNGRRSGNGWLIKVGQRDTGREIFTVYTVLTDAGSSMDMTEQELETQFEVGDWICTLDRIASEFDRHGIMKAMGIC